MVFRCWGRHGCPACGCARASGHLGWTLAAGSGELVAAAVLGQPVALSLDEYRLDRFDRPH
jgi:glycine/D-amino acid oxidase-like deaminating enzyme